MPMRLVDGGAGGLRIIGQHPEAQGSFGELVVVAESLAKPVQGPVSNDAVALVDAFAVGEFYVRAAQLETGEIPIVIGAGAVGLSAVAALAGRGADPIIVSDYKAERRRIAESSFGAHVLVDPAERDVFDVFREVRAERGLPGPAVVFECVGASGLMQKIVNDCDFYTAFFVPAAGTAATVSASPMRHVRESRFSSAAALTRRTGMASSRRSPRVASTRCRVSARSLGSIRFPKPWTWPGGLRDRRG
jgi:threonine dehydrogenase-like Zn-dependent dehydrogenase